MDMTGFIPPRNRIAEPDTPLLSPVPGLSESYVSDLDIVFDLIDRETRERSWAPLKKGGTLVSTLTAPSQDKAQKFGVRALRYTGEADGLELV
jgi:hypothetical protein